MILSLIRTITLYYLIAFNLTACCTKPSPVVRTVVQEVYIPQPCLIPTPIKPKISENTIEMFIAMIKYTRILEEALKTCNGGRID